MSAQAETTAGREVLSDTRGGADDPARVGDQSNIYRRFYVWAQRVHFERRLAIALLIAAILSGSATFAAMTGYLPRAGSPKYILLLLNLDLILLLGLGALVARRLVVFWMARKRGVAGARLHARITGLFAIVAVIPTIVVAAFSVILFDFGLQGWFNERVSTAVKESLVVAQAYLEEHRNTINADIVAMAQDVNREGGQLQYNPQRFNQFVSTQAALRALTEAIIFDESGRVLARADFSLLMNFDPRVPDWAMERAKQGEAVILTAPTEDRVRALVRLDSLPNAYLYVGRLIDPRVLNHMDRTADAVQLYEAIEEQRSGMITSFALVFIVVALLLLFAAVWVGLAFATQLTRPIGDLISAAERVGKGDLEARVVIQDDSDELGTLSHSFNRMTEELQHQQAALIEANEQIEERHRFIQAVLGGVSAGVIGLDQHGKVTLPNRSACALLSISEQKLRGQHIGEVSPDMADLVDAARARPFRVHQHQVGLVRQDGTQAVLLVRVTAEKSGTAIIGYVVTFDDVTELISAQRKAAWADVARRIAHEIKNPLTPIQLSAERLRRKYLPRITEDREAFEVCTDTIIRQVGDIRAMVDEFSAFARMPTPRMEEHDLGQLVTQALQLQQQGQGDIAYTLDLPEKRVTLSCDEAQIGRAMTNLLQNAADAIEGRKEIEGEAAPRGEVSLRVYEEQGDVLVEISDNGRGLPKSERHRLTEPYVTTRERGTGLGLAIVKKIMEDHGGDIALGDRDGGGATVRLIFPAQGETAGA
ncbi:MAG: PAS domain-containing sensor histidine kinase [Rhodovibrionaceae bacterium]